MKKLYAAILLQFIFFHVFAQDVHFSQYYSFNPVLNPALTGNFDGSYRISAIYRNQGYSFLNKYAYVTPAASVEVALMEGILKGDKFGLGIFALNDVSGSAGLSNLTAGASLAYHFAFGKRDQHVISLGYQAAFTQKRIDPERTTFFDQFDEISWSGYNPTTENFDQSSFYYFDHNAGIYWKSQFSKLIGVNLGLAAFHLSEPDEAFIISGNNLSPLYRRFAADLGLTFTFKEKVIFQPEGLYMFQGPLNGNINNQQQITVGASLGYRFFSGFRNNTNLMVGCRYRLNDAVIPMLSVEFRNMRIGAAYDVTLSDLNASNRNQGAFEVALTYTGESIKSYKANKTLPARRF